MKTGCASLRGRRLVIVVAIVAVFVSGAVGTVAAQEEVSNAQELQDVRDDLDGDYVVTDDIDLSGVSNFDPIGDFNDPFTGTFDGDGHNITGLTVNRDDELDVGLFGAVGSGGEVRNVGVRNADVSGRQWVGALVGTNQGDVRDSYATGDVVAANRTGGLVGTTTPSGKVIDSYAEGTVTAEFIAGGLAGTNEGEISRSYANVSVSGFSEVEAVDMGGLVGVNVGDVTESYARGEVLGDESLGGLVGASDGEVVESYATGEVVGDTDTGGIVGNLSFGFRQTTLRDSYWDTEETNQQDASGAVVGNPTVQNVDGLSTDEMFGDAASGNMTAFDFTNTWATVTDPDDYPVLAWQIEDDGDADPAIFEVSVDSTNSPVTEGETLTVDVTVENTGGEQGTQTVSLTVGGTVRDSVDVILSEGGSTTRTLEWVTGDGDAGSYTASVSTDNDTDTSSVAVETDDGDGFDLDDYRNQNGNVDTGGLQQAINDFVQGNIGTGDLQAVINAFVQGR